MDKHEEVAVILAVDDVDKLSLPLRRRFSLEIELAVPSLRERIEILEIIFKNCKNVDSDAILNLARLSLPFYSVLLFGSYSVAGTLVKLQ